MTNPHADRVKAVRALATRSGRRRAGRYVVEGPQAVREVVRWAPGTVRDVYLTAEAADRYAEIVADAEAARLHVHLGDEAVLDAMSPDAQGVLAVADLPDAARTATVDEVPVGPSGAEALDAVLAARPRLVAVLAQVRDPGNAGTVIRVADAAGADAVVVAGDSVETTNPKVVRSTAGSLFHLPVVSGVSVADAVDALRAAGLAVLAADGTGDLDLDDLQDAAAVAGAGTGTAAETDAAATADLRAATAWLFGNEAWGLPPEDRDRADAVVRVPLRGRAESLNLGTAAAVCLYASSRAHR
ncbi:RNA methyltransferase [Cellulomonas sp. PS-H5]|uniref:TrmH family RNA methyltransferase n=1 Tax=Cellulomonas sp. PS-H5 TaxID=2820400 RepID=UPI001C4E89EB|nr:RNA methyltransferase [Cellulomonas sp. PS-H5]MBW0255765.1 RNA methyltransferase [Cellulomonas sp. PS-H5]